jgi:hypothetical protein
MSEAPIQVNAGLESQPVMPVPYEVRSRVTII